MSLFQPPPRTRYDLHFTIAGFPVYVHPLFWVMAILFGINTGGLVPLLLWVVIVFVSILIHELGHSLTMRRYGIDSYIVLHMMGGLAIPSSSRRWNIGWLQQVLISLAGPVAGFLLAGLVIVAAVSSGGTVVMTWFLKVIPLPRVFVPGGWMENYVAGTMLWVNVFWGLINLLPVNPLDGGHISRHIFVRIDPWNGVRKSLWLSTITGAILAIVGLVVLNDVYLALLFGLLAFQSYQML